MDDGVFYGIFDGARPGRAAAWWQRPARTFWHEPTALRPLAISTPTRPTAARVWPAVTSAVTADLLAAGLDVVLNVHENNNHALRIYQRLGYQIHCRFIEGPAQCLIV
ncbi:MAG: hypothetical protein HZY76_06825 [Anaerolineae bacterium]|nr:MAG: hypothetical protein HZY76_06825 [Anaerolineae bacterium]